MEVIVLMRCSRVVACSIELLLQSDGITFFKVMGLPALSDRATANAEAG
jgi:hypothetical protein